MFVLRAAPVSSVAAQARQLFANTGIAASFRRTAAFASAVVQSNNSNINNNNNVIMSSAPATITAAAGAVVAPPTYKKVDHTVLFGNVPGEVRTTAESTSALIDPPIARNDPYFWLRDDERTNEEVLDLLRAENEYYAAQMTSTEELAETIYNEHISHIKETDDTCPFAHGPYNYYTKTFEGKSFVTHVRRLRNDDAAEEEVLLDVNVLAEGRAMCAVHQVEPDPRSHTVIAYSIDFVGNECYELKFVRVGADAGTDETDASGRVLKDKDITGTTGEIVWMPDGSAVCYMTRDEAKRSDTVWYHRLADPDTSRDVMLFTEPDPLFNVGAEVSADGEYLLISAVSIMTTEVHYLPLRELLASGARPDPNTLRCFRKREVGIRYSVESWHAGNFFVLANTDGCKTMQLLFVEDRDMADWTNVVVPCDPATTFEGLTVIKGAVLLEGRKNGLTQIWVCKTVRGAERATGSRRAVLDGPPAMMSQPEQLFDVGIINSHNRGFDTSVVRMSYSSMTTPTEWIDFDVATGSRTVRKTKEVPSYDASLYVCERRWATALDGTKIPMSISRRKTTGPLAPTLLYGYGAYGLTIDPRFSIGPLPLLDRGFVYAVAHIRGGGEMGRLWYEQATFLRKRVSFTDFVACAEALIDQGVTTPELMAAEGRSAGGLLMGAVANMRPDLFKAMVAGVPFVDVMTTMCDVTIPLTANEWEEWGNPNAKKYFYEMLSYSPVDNVMRQRYPNLLVTAGLHDPRCGYWEPTKWVAKLREHHVDPPGLEKREILLKMDLEAGHFSATDRYKYWREYAKEQAFIIKHILGAK